MKVEMIRENPDGSADFNFDMNPEEISAMIRFGIMTALKNAIEEGNLYDPSKSDLGNTTSGGADSVHGTSQQSNEPGSTGDGFKTSQVLG
jgi:hypothetical protein